MTPGKKFDLSKATVEIAGKSLSANFDNDAVEAVITTELPKGTTTLSAQFHGDNGSTVGAYYAYIERIE